MELWTQEIAAQTPALYATEDVNLANKQITAKFFALGSGLTWYVAEAETQADGDVLFFGYVDHGGDAFLSEWGYFTLNELTALQWWGIPRVERDLHFHAKPFYQIAHR
ncbi:DUF2958 domain-containing protein [Alicyclobacillus ferrooxydans]|uniref:DUF2958 domain-containing protein n=1 Tax=Alicyclobacillus ferrooxydans TaxID=471514 RepID=UPI0006D5B3DF|nr:DUF2958 domain-containing protein [Alicyclobacillus ferrooxydans]